MKILATQFTLKYNAFELYTSGCKAPHCQGCHNPEGWDFTIGEDYSHEYFRKIEEKVNSFKTLIKNIMVFGGEPLDNSLEDLKMFFNDLKTLQLPIWLFTRYDLTEVPIEIIELCDYIKTGRYIESLKSSGNIQYKIELATTNQKIYNKEELKLFLEKSFEK